LNLLQIVIIRRSLTSIDLSIACTWNDGQLNSL